MSKLFTTKVLPIFLKDLDLSDMELCEDEYFYWRATENGGRYYSIVSYVLFDYLRGKSDLKYKQTIQNFKKHYSLANGIFPHLSKIYQDRDGETISCFTDFHTIKIWPILNRNTIKIQNFGKFEELVTFL